MRHAVPGAEDDADLTGALSRAEIDRRAGLPPRQVGRYRVDKEIGRGGEGVVYAASDLETGAKVALKALPEIYAGDASRRARLEREARVLTLVSHPGFAAIHGIEETPAGLFLVLELVPGETLRERLSRGRLSVISALDIGLQIAAALEAAHERRIVHRDLKPSNIKVTPAGVVKILDFGLAKVVHEREGPWLAASAEQNDDTSRAGFVVGTVAYMSPEQTRGGALDRRVDVWAFGCVLFECLTGTRIWAGGSVAATLAAIRTREPDWSALGAGVAAPVLELLHACLRKDAHRRWVEMGDVCATLGQALAELGAKRPEFLDRRRRRGNLPRQLRSFHGRSRELEAVASLASMPGLVTIHGWGGTGKTRLALEIAERSEVTHPDGAWYVDLTTLDHDSRVPLAIAVAIGVKETTGRSTEESLAQYFAGHRAILVLDGCEHVLRGTRDLAERLVLSCPLLSLFATSREPLAARGERVYSLQPLAVPDADAIESPDGGDAVGFFVTRARQAVVDFRLDEGNRRAVLDICRRLDGLPLALELAAARVRWLPVDAIARGLSERLGTISASGSLVPARHHTLDALVDWSHQHLSPSEKTLLRRLAVFAGSWELEAAEAACADGVLPESRVVECVEGLLSRSLLVCERSGGAVRYRLLETVRSYARARLQAAAEEAATTSGYLDFYVELSVRLAPLLQSRDQVEAFARLEQEHANLMAALALAAQPVRAARGSRLAAALIEYWLWRGLAREGRRATAAVPRAGLDPTERGRLEHALGRLSVALDECQTARPWLESALQLAREVGDWRLEVSCGNELGNVAWRLGELGVATTLLKASEVLARTGGDVGLIADNLVNRGCVELERGDVAEARARWHDALELRRLGGDARSLATLASNLAGLEHQQDNPAAAGTFALEALELRRELRDGPGIASALINLSTTMRQRDPDTAVAYLEEALRVFERHGRQEGVAMVANNLACLAEAQRDFVSALKWYRVGLGVAQTAGLRRHHPVFLENFASLASAEGRPRRASLLVGAAARIRREASVPLPPLQKTVVDGVQSSASVALGEAETQAIEAQGAALSESDAIAYALADQD